MSNNHQPERLLVALFLLLFTYSSFAQPTRNKNEGFDNTFWEVQRALYKWGAAERATDNALGKSDADIWYYKDTEPMAGYVLLKDGTRIEGDFSKRYHYNKASTYQITVDGKKKDNPEGKSYYEARIKEEDSKWEVYPLDQLVSFGIDYQMDDGEDLEFNEGQLNFRSGEVRRGNVIYLTWNSPLAGLKYSGQFLFAADEKANVEKIQSDELESAIVDGKEFLALDDWLVPVDDFKVALTEKATENKLRALAPATITLQDGSKHTGQVAIEDKKRINNAYFVSDNGDYLLKLTTKNAGLLHLENGAKYVKYQSYIWNQDDLQKKWEKTGDMNPGVIMLSSGEKLEGTTFFQRHQNAVKSYRFIDGVYFFPTDGSIGYLFNAGDEIDYVEQTVGGNTTRYVPVAGLLKDYKDFVADLRKNDSKNPTENLQPGYLVMADGIKKEGEIAASKFKMSFIGAGNDLEQFSSSNKELSYYVQVIDGKERKFIPMARRAKAFGPSSEFVELVAHDKPFSYYNNPYPTNVRKGVTNLGGSVIEASAQSATNKIAEKAAEQSAKQEYNASGDLAKTAVAANQAYSNTQETLGQIDVVGDEGGIFFEEVVILDNANNKQYVIFKRNDQEVLSSLLSQCDKFKGLKSRDQKRITRMESVGEAIELLNSCQ